MTKSLKDIGQCNRGKPTYDFADPEWVNGWRDAQTQGAWSSAPDMRRGMSYAMGWLTGRLQKDAPSLRSH